MNQRKAAMSRQTAETAISVALDIDGSGRSVIETGIGFFDHLLTALAKHSLIDLEIKAAGDLHVDGHHTVEDTGILLGRAIAAALGEGEGLVRFGHAYCPLDEALARAVVDISGRGYFAWKCPPPLRQVGDFDGELLPEFLRALAVNAGITLHAALLAGRNQHHIMESVVKAVARALRMAASLDPRQPGVPRPRGRLG